MVERISALYSHSPFYYSAIIPEKTISGDIYKAPHRCVRPIDYRQDDTYAANSPQLSPVEFLSAQQQPCRQYSFPYHNNSSNSNSAHTTPIKRRELIQQTIYEATSPGLSQRRRIYNTAQNHSPAPYKDPPSIQCDYASPYKTAINNNNVLSQSLQVPHYNTLRSSEQSFRRHNEKSSFPLSPSSTAEKNFQYKHVQNFVNYNTLNRHPKHKNELLTQSYCAQESLISEIKWPASYLPKNKTLSDRDSYRSSPKPPDPITHDLWTPTRHGGYKWTPVSSATYSVYSGHTSQSSSSSHPTNPNTPYLRTTASTKRYNDSPASDDTHLMKSSTRHHSDSAQAEYPENLVHIDKDGYAEITSLYKDGSYQSRSLPRNIKCFNKTLEQHTSTKSPLPPDNAIHSTAHINMSSGVRNKIFRFPLNDIPCQLKKLPGETAGEIVLGGGEYKIPRLCDEQNDDSSRGFSKSLDADRERSLHPRPQLSGCLPDSSDTTTSSSDYYEIMTNLPQLRPKAKQIKHTRPLGHENRFYDKDNVLSNRASNASSTSTVSTTSSSDVYGHMEERLTNIKNKMTQL